MPSSRKIAVGAAVLLAGMGTAAVVVAGRGTSERPANKANYVANDSHLHLTNYVQEGTNIRDFLAIMGDQVGRSTLFGIPLQQTWSYRLSANDAPTYYLETDADLYYYSFTDAHIALAYRSLDAAQQARFDPMITGFNPADMYAADHVRRVLEEFPGVFVGIGEFSIHKEFVTAKVAGDAPSVGDPALDRLLDFAGEVGLVVLVHCDVDVPFPKPNQPPAYLESMIALFKRHPKTTFIWAHIGLGRVIRPFQDQAKMVVEMLEDPDLRHVNFDISWSETAKYLLATPATIDRAAAVMQRHRTRFLFGTDEVAPTDQANYLKVYRQYQPLWDRLEPAVSEQVRKGNYARIFDAARTKVRAWEKKHRKTVDEHHQQAGRAHLP